MSELFADGETIQTRAKITKAAGTMYRRHGRCAGKTCGQCKNLLRKKWTNGKIYYKCMNYALDNSPTTDFRKSFPACGKFEEVTHE